MSHTTALHLEDTFQKKSIIVFLRPSHYKLEIQAMLSFKKIELYF